METNQAQNQTQPRLHPLMAGAAVSVIVVSLLGAAAFAGLLPSSARLIAAPDMTRISADTSTEKAPQKIALDAPPIQNNKLKTGSDPVKDIIKQKATPQREYAQRQAETTYAAAPTYREPAYRDSAYREPVHREAAYPAPADGNSALGIGVGALVGGLLGSQIGGGNGRTLAAIAGAVGGGYVGNEMAKNR
jgi:uncharacterized protein YcfJ